MVHEDKLLSLLWDLNNIACSVNKEAKGLFYLTNSFISNEGVYVIKINFINTYPKKSLNIITITTPTLNNSSFRDVYNKFLSCILFNKLSINKLKDAHGVVVNVIPIYLLINYGILDSYDNVELVKL